MMNENSAYITPISIHLVSMLINYTSCSGMTPVIIVHTVNSYGFARYALLVETKSIKSFLSKKSIINR